MRSSLTRYLAQLLAISGGFDVGTVLQRALRSHPPYLLTLPGHFPPLLARPSLRSTGFGHSSLTVRLAPRMPPLAQHLLALAFSTPRLQSALRRPPVALLYCESLPTVVLVPARDCCVFGFSSSRLLPLRHLAVSSLLFNACLQEGLILAIKGKDALAWWTVREVEAVGCRTELRLFFMLKATCFSSFSTITFFSLSISVFLCASLSLRSLTSACSAYTYTVATATSALSLAALVSCSSMVSCITSICSFICCSS